MKKFITLLMMLALITSCKKLDIRETTEEQQITPADFSALLNAKDITDSGLEWNDKNENKTLEINEIKGGKNGLIKKDKRNTLIYEIAELTESKDQLTKSDISEYINILFKEDNSEEFTGYAKAYENTLTEAGNSYLIQAAQNNSVKIFSYIIEENNTKEYINMQNESGSTALMEAVKAGSNEVVEMLLQNGADKKIEDNRRKTALMHAFINNNEKAKELIGVPDKYILDVPCYIQNHHLSCESISAAMISDYYKLKIPENTEEPEKPYSSWEDYYLRIIKVHEDPHIGFRGDPYGDMSTHHHIKGLGYGVYAEPIAAEMNKVGLKTTIKYDVNYDDVENDLRCGRPQIVWVSAHKSPSRTVTVNEKKIRLTFGEHAWVVTGVKGKGKDRKFLVNHAVPGIRKWIPEFMRWEDFQNYDGKGGMRVTATM